jgi:hypothetical protein
VRTDAEILDILEMRESGLSCRLSGLRLGTTKGAIIGLLGRIDRVTESSRHDGTMPASWWRAGLKRRRQ